MPQEMLTGLFEAAGFTCDDYRLHERQIENRRQQVVMHRCWVQAVFTYNPPAQPCLQPTAPLTQALQDGHGSDSHARAAAAADQQPSLDSSSSAQAQHSGALGRHALPSDQQALATNQQAPATKQQPAGKASLAAAQTQAQLAAHQESQQPSSPDASALACAPQPSWPVPSCSSQACDQQQHSVQGQQGSQHAPSTEMMTGALALEQMTQCEAGQAAAACSAATQRQEWEEGGTTPEQEPLTGCLFADSTFEEVLLSPLPCPCSVAFVHPLPGCHPCRHAQGGPLLQRQDSPRMHHIKSLDSMSFLVPILSACFGFPNMLIQCD